MVIFINHTMANHKDVVSRSFQLLFDSISQPFIVSRPRCSLSYHYPLGTLVFLFPSIECHWKTQLYFQRLWMLLPFCSFHHRKTQSFCCLQLEHFQISRFIVCACHHLARFGSLRNLLFLSYPVTTACSSYRSDNSGSRWFDWWDLFVDLLFDFSL